MKLDPEPAGAPAEYAFWTESGSGTRVEYSLATFHEIDFQVNEGYRRIPHGGIEIGGILWGRKTAGGVAIEAFRQIECEHASGPSFSLSERDLNGIAELLTKARGEEALRDVEPVGWFVAHTRSSLVLTDRELAIFDRFFPGTGRITMLVKPERFQPTRFGFLLRGNDGGVPRDAAGQAFILPLPGRAGKGVVASIPAPTVKPSRANPAPEQPPVTPKPEPVAAPYEAAPEPVVFETAVTPQEPVKPKPLAPEPAKPIAPVESVDVPPAVEEMVPRKRNEQFRGMPEAPPAAAMPPISARANSSGTFRLFLLLLVAAALGCAVGYLAYLQLPSPFIALQVQKRGASLLIEWPPEQTRGLEYTAVRVDDGPPQLLSSREKESGVLEVPARGDNTKVEIIAQHWIRDSRGIARYVGLPSRAAEVRTPAKTLDKSAGDTTADTPPL